MHEAAIAQSIVDIVERQVREEGYRQVKRIGVRVGHLSSIVPESLVFAFQALSRGTVAERAELDITEEAAQGCCRDCGARFSVDSLLAVCRDCGSGNVEVSGGDALIIESMDVEQ